MKNSTEICAGTGIFLLLSAAHSLASDPFPTPVTGPTANAVQTSQNCVQVNATHQKCSVANPPLASAAGGAWGPNRFLQSNVASPGYKLESVTFKLVGPHPCTGNDASPHSGPNHEPWGNGSWAKCWQVSKTDDHVVWGYTIQGGQGNTTFSAGVSSSQGLQLKWVVTNDYTVSEAAVLELVYVKS
jgi:hypothetical protein